MAGGRRRAGGPGRTGFTLVELLVCLGVIGLLISLILAGVQAARSQARRLECLNRIRQLSLACQDYESAHRAFPRTVDGLVGGLNGEFESLSPHVQLLPYVEQRPLFESLTLPERNPGGKGQPPASTQNPAALAAFVPLFVCPEDGLATGGATNYRACMGIGPAILGNSTWEYGNGSGPWKAWRSVRTAEVQDGLSNMVLFGEKLTGDRDPESYTPWRDVARAPVAHGPHTIAETESACVRVGPEPEHRSYDGTAWLFGGYEQTWYNHLFPPNSPTPDCGFSYGAYTARSFHSGGVNVSLADGSARLVADGIDLDVWRAMSTRRLGEPASDF